MKIFNANQSWKYSNVLLDDVGNFILLTFIQLVCANSFQWYHRCRSATPYFYSVIKVIKDFLFKCFFPPNYNYHFTTKKSLPELEKLIECLYARKACQSIGPLRVPKNTSLLMLLILFFSVFENCIPMSFAVVKIFTKEV